MFFIFLWHLFCSFLPNLGFRPRFSNPLTKKSFLLNLVQTENLSKNNIFHLIELILTLSRSPTYNKLRHIFKERVFFNSLRTHKILLKIFQQIFFIFSQKHDHFVILILVPKLHRSDSLLKFYIINSLYHFITNSKLIFKANCSNHITYKISFLDDYLHLENVKPFKESDFKTL